MLIQASLLSISFILASMTGLLPFYGIFFIVFVFYLFEIFAIFTAPYVSTVGDKQATMMALADIKSGMRVYDLGAGDGILVEKATEKGAQAVGYEVSAGVYLIYLVKKKFLGRKGKVV